MTFREMRQVYSLLQGALVSPYRMNPEDVDKIADAMEIVEEALRVHIEQVAQNN